MTLKSDAKFEEKLTLGSKNDMRNLVNFNRICRGVFLCDHVPGGAHSGPPAQILIEKCF